MSDIAKRLKILEEYARLHRHPEGTRQALEDLQRIWASSAWGGDHGVPVGRLESYAGADWQQGYLYLLVLESRRLLGLGPPEEPVNESAEWQRFLAERDEGEDDID